MQMRDQRAIGIEAMMRIAARQYGVVTGAQLKALGIDKSGVHRRVRSGALHRVQPGVFAVGRPKLSRQGLWIAAVLTLGETAVLSHHSAAELWALLPTQAGSGPIHVAVPDTGGRRRRPGRAIHRLKRLSANETTRRQGNTGDFGGENDRRSRADLQRRSGPSGEAASGVPRLQLRRSQVRPHCQ
jgi:hypothetical protein